MNEAQVAATLAARLEEVQTPAEAPVAPSETEPPQDYVDKITPEDFVTKAKLLDWFEIPPTQRHFPKVDKYIDEIYAWAKQNAPNGSIAEILQLINDREAIMGSRNKGGRLAKMYEFVKISKLRQEIMARESLLYG